MRRIGKISLAALFASGVLTGSAAADEFVYVGNSDSNDISVFQMTKEDGALSLIETVPFAGVEKPGGSVPMAVSPNKHFLYAGIRSQPYVVLTFSIAPQTGKLTQVGKSELADSLASIDTDHSGKFLFGASYGDTR
uniref:beta-propeller fold lactonase family protein n=1 Tax=Neorhizobium sp. EC2-8 TaxID=3129230 RepID=UPI003100D2FD